MNKTELIKRIHELMDIPPMMAEKPSKRTLAVVLDALAEAVAETLEEGEAITLPGIGKLTTEFRPAHTGRNPKTGETLEIAARDVVRFRPTESLKQRINKGVF